MKRLLSAIIDNTIITIASLFVMWPFLFITTAIVVIVIHVAKFFGV